MLYGCSIPVNAFFSAPPCFPHGLHGIFISGGATIGSGCVIFQQVTIGSNTLVDSPRKGAPTVGNNVYIGAGAKIIGRVRVGNNVRIGANTVVYEDVPDSSLVVSGKQTIIPRESLDNRYFSYRYGSWYYYDQGCWVEAEDQALFTGASDSH